MNDHRVHADLLHQHDIAGEAFHLGIVTHRVATELDDHRRAGVALKVGQGL